MTCIAPPALTDAVLLRYLDGEAADEVMNHLQACGSCRARTKELALVHGLFAKKLFRANCPTSSELGEYRLNILGVRASRQIKRHLDVCIYCPSELEELDEYLGLVSSDINHSSSQRLRRLVAQLLSSGSGIPPALPSFAPALSGVRGEGRRPVIYRVEDVQIALTTVPKPEMDGMNSILGIVTALPDEGCRALLVKDATVLAHSAVDAAGTFIFDALPAGKYKLILRCEEVEIVIEEFQV